MRTANGERKATQSTAMCGRHKKIYDTIPFAITSLSPSRLESCTHFSSSLLWNRLSSLCVVNIKCCDANSFEWCSRIAFVNANNYTTQLHNLPERLQSYCFEYLPFARYSRSQCGQLNERESIWPEISATTKRFTSVRHKNKH